MSKQSVGGFWFPLGFAVWAQLTCYYGTWQLVYPTLAAIIFAIHYNR